MVRGRNAATGPPGVTAVGYRDPGTTDSTGSAGITGIAGNTGSAGNTGVEVMGDGGSALATARSRIRRAVPLLIGAIVLAVTILVNLLPGPEADDRPLSPGNPAPEGARALAEVLEAQGTDIIRAGSYEEAVEALGNGSATLFLQDAHQYLSADQVAELAMLADRSVIAAPGERQLTALDDEFTLLGPVPVDLTGDASPPGADCPDPDAVAAGTLSSGGTAYSGPVECFPTSIVSVTEDVVTGDVVTGDDATGGLYVTGVDGSVAILGAPEAFSNRSITEEGNAALALRILGSSPTLVWYEPSGSDVTSTGEGIDPLTLLPTWVDSLLVWLLACAVLAMLWRGRRLGPLASEPLPVTVRAAETAEGRARLYQDSRSVGHAAATLRAAALARLARALRVDRSASPSEVIEAAARQSGMPRIELERQLLDHTPTTNRELVLWAQEILDLEKEITP